MGAQCLTISGLPVRNTRPGFIPIKIFWRTLLILLFSPVCSRQHLFSRLSQVEDIFASLFLIEYNKDQTQISKTINDDNEPDLLPQLAVTTG